MLFGVPTHPSLENRRRLTQKNISNISHSFVFLAFLKLSWPEACKQGVYLLPLFCWGQTSWFGKYTKNTT